MTDSVTATGSPPAGTRLRVGGIDYLNAQPLLYGLAGPGDPALEVADHRPADLADMLFDGRLDVALVPVVAYPERSDYWVIPGVSISSYGPVKSIRLYYRRPLGQARRVALDTSSRTSSLLTRLLFRDYWHGEPDFDSVAPDELHRRLVCEPSSAPDFDAALLIGDAALSCGRFPGWESVDLGTEWTRWTGLPFVYAFWVIRAPGGSDGIPPGLVERFVQARDRGISRIDEIVRTARRPEGMSESDCRHYLYRVIQYDLRPEQLEGLDSFFRRLRNAGLLAGAGGPLRTLPSPVTV